MIVLFGILKKHYQTEFSALKFLLVLSFVLLAVVFEYQVFSIRSYILKIEQIERIPVYFIFYFTLSFLVLVILKGVSVKEPKISWNLVGVLLLFSALCGFYQSYYVAGILKQLQLNSETSQSLFDAVVTKGSSIITIIIPCVVVYLLLRNRQDSPSFFGLTTTSWIIIRPYIQTLSVCFVMIFLSSFLTDISTYYPLYAKSALVKNHELIGLPFWFVVLWFEFFYAFSFISVELLFRGLLLFLLFRHIKADALLVMASVYAVFHYGKPMAETLSSFLGGYILGVFALANKNIWGGIILHIGIAMFMEVITSFV